MKKRKLMKIKPIRDDLTFRVTYQPWQFILTNFHEVIPQSRQDFPQHVHVSFELIVPTGKRYRCRLDHQELVVPRGSFLLIQPGQRHIDHYARGENFLCLHFRLKKEEKEEKEALLQLFVPGLSPEKQVAKIAFREFLDDLLKVILKYRDLPLPPICLDYGFFSVLQLFLSAYPVNYLRTSSNRETGHSYVYNLIYQYFEKCLLSGDFSLDDFRKVLRCSARTLTRVCNEYFYASPAQAFQSYRMDCAMDFLLKNPGIRVKEVSDYFHYPNPFYFSRLFRKRFGCPPSRIRRELESFTQKKSRPSS